MKKISLFLVLTIIASTLAGFSVQAANDLELITSGVSIKAGETTAKNISIKNTSSFELTNISVTSPSADITASSSSTIASLAAGETQSVSVKLTAPSSSIANDYIVELLFSYAGGSQPSQTLYLNVYTSATPEDDDVPTPTPTPTPANSPKITMTAPASKVTATAGKTTAVNVTIKNIGNATAKAINIHTPVMQDFVVSLPNRVYEFPLSANSTKEFTLNITPDKDLKAGNYTVKFNYTYENEQQKEFDGSAEIYLKVEKASGSETDGKRAAIEITSIVSPIETFEVGQNATVVITIANRGENTAKNVKITAAPEEGVVPKSANTIMVNSLGVGQSKELTFVFAPTAAATTQNYSIGFTVDYQTGELDDEDVPKTDQFMQYVGINVSNPEKDKEEDEDKIKSVPKIIISKYNLDPLIVQAGTEFDIDLTFLNTHSTKTVSNITISLSVIATETEKGNVFTPVESSNIFYIEKIAPKGTVDEHIRMYTVPDAKAKNYIITATFKYEDEDGNNLESTAEFGVNVKQISKLELGDIYFPEQMNVGEQQYLNFSLQNTGKVTLYNLKVKVEGDGIDNSASEQIFGNFTSGSVEYYDASFMPRDPGQTTLRLVVSYDNDMGERVERVEEYNCFINEMMMGDMGMEGGMMGEKFPGGMEFDKDGNPIDPNAPKGFSFASLMKNVWFWTGTGVVLAVIVVVAVLVIRKRKQRKGFDLDE